MLTQAVKDDLLEEVAFQPEMGIIRSIIFLEDLGKELSKQRKLSVHGR